MLVSLLLMPEYSITGMVCEFVGLTFCFFPSLVDFGPGVLSTLLHVEGTYIGSVPCYVRGVCVCALFRNV